MILAVFFRPQDGCGYTEGGDKVDGGDAASFTETVQCNMRTEENNVLCLGSSTRGVFSEIWRKTNSLSTPSASAIA
jgi:hypothetical protein